MQPEGPATQEPMVEYCYRHPTEQTGVHCTRCGRPICPACMIPAPVGHQCPECVAQARREFRQGPAAPGRAARRFSATNVILAAIAVGFLAEIAVGGPNALFQGPPVGKLVDLGAANPLLIASGQYWRLVSSMFLHAGLLHIGFNAYALVLFGRQMEAVLGRWRFLFLYFLTGLLAGVASYAFAAPRDVGVGASGAIFGVFGVFIAYNYRRRHLAAAAMNLRWAWTIILLNALLAFSFRTTIDWHAHLGGLVAGLAAGSLLDGVGPRAAQAAIRWAGLAALIAAGLALFLWRTAELRDAFPFLQRLLAR